MSSKFFSRRIAFFGNIALVILCVIFFLVPFGFRGARMAVDGMRNDVKDWLPKDFKETEELRWFHQYFIGSSFVIVTWPGANEDDPTFDRLVEKLRAETKPLYDELADPSLSDAERERIRARLKGDELGLFFEDDLNEDWGGLGEKWLDGDDNDRYFLTPDGELFRWSGKSNLIGYLKRRGERLITGANEAKGVLVDKFGEPSKPGKLNEFHENPRLLTARLFQTVQTGPDVLNELAGEGGSLRDFNADDSDEESGADRDKAYKRLSGLLFGPVVPKGFTWELDDFKRICPDRRLARLPRSWEQHYSRYVNELLKTRFADRHTDKFWQQHASKNSLDKEGLAEFKKTQSEEELRRVVFEAFEADYDRDNELARLVAAPQSVRAEHWNAMFAELGRQCPGSFKWTLHDFEKVLTAAQLSDLEFRWKDGLKQSIEQLVDEQYGGNLNALKNATKEEQRLHWEAIFQQLNYPAPTPLTWDVIEFSDSIVYKQETNDLRNRWKDEFNSVVKELADLYYGGDQERLVQAPVEEQLGHWQSLLAKLGLESDTAPPARQTCVVATLSEPGRRDFSRVIGRKVMGKPLGRILQIATYPIEKGGLGIDENELRIGGPPVDNVAIDEEGKITLARLVSFSALVGLTLAMICFRSFKVTIMVFFVGGVSAACSLGIVWWCGSSVDAILMTMPSLVYVLGLSGAVHIVNYYRDAARESGLAGAPETAIGHGWFPCTLAAFTTSLGLISLYFGSNVVPIQKFGLFSAIGTLATVLLLFTFLPSALQLWPPGYHKEAKKKKRPSQMGDALTKFWDVFGGWIVRRHWWVTGVCTIAFIAFALGLPKIKTSVHLLKLFDGDARIIEDYTWIEGHLGKLVPMELVVGVDKEMQRPTLDELELIPPGERKSVDEALKYSFLERAVMADRIQEVVEENFRAKHDVVGNGMSTGTLIPDLPSSSADSTTVLGFNRQLERHRDELLKQDYLKIDKKDGRELWRISLRLGSLNDIDYGLFVGELKKAVEPVLAAYRYRTQILRSLYDDDSSSSTRKRAILVLGGPMPEEKADEEVTPVSTDSVAQDEYHFDIDQTRIFCETLNHLFYGKGFRQPRRGRRSRDKEISWHTPETQPLEELFSNKQAWAERIGRFDTVVLVRDHADYDVAFIKDNSKRFIDAREHVFVPEESLTATERREDGESDVAVAVTYTGIVPIVYKAQRTLLESLKSSIGLAFVMIAIVMMILLRDWRSKFSLKNSVNLGGGLASMIPNVFPIVIIFGAMGHFGTLVDIGTMMTASVAMGVAVDDTIHFLNWYRHGLGRGMERKQAIALAYNRCATAMTQTTLIGGFGLAVFAFSTFVPTQKFGTMMLTLLAAALVGDLLFLPAILAGPLGPLFGKTRQPKPESEPESQSEGTKRQRVTESVATRHSGRAGQTQGAAMLRQDGGHKLPGET